jgi:alpha-D-ribose 1-methylphosphonate 5-triphosphate synthase subunit PhnH
LIADQDCFNLFDAQKVFRCLLNAMARPGVVKHLPVTGVPLEAGISGQAAAIAFTLLDREICFCVLGRKGEEKVNYLALNTGSRPVSLPEADFILAPGEEELPQLALAKRGTLEYPDQSATVILILEKISAAPLPGQGEIAVNLSGPGAPGSRRLFLAGLHPAHLEHFHFLNSEYPLGVDYILADQEGQVACLPRTATVK